MRSTPKITLPQHSSNIFPESMETMTSKLLMSASFVVTSFSSHVDNYFFDSASKISISLPPPKVEFYMRFAS
jgi:hypothetical protein